MRRAQADKSSQPVRNLAANPNFAYASGTNNIRTNLAMNPRFDAGSTGHVVRQNLITNPALASGTLWNTYGGGTTYSAVTTSREAVDWSASGWAYKVQGSTTSTPAMAEIGTGTFDITAGTVLTFSIYVTAGASRKVRIRSRSNVSDIWSSDFTVGTTPTRISLTLTVPTGATNIGFSIKEAYTPEAFGENDWIAASMALVEKGNDVLPYFDGSTRANLCTNSSFETGTTGWAGKGSSSIARDTTRAWTGNTSLKVTSSGTSAAGAGFTATGLVVGRKYTMSGYIYSPTGQPSVTSTVADIGYGTSNGTTKDQWVRVSMTWTATLTSHNVGFDFAGSPTSGQYFFIDAVTLTTGSDVANYVADDDFTYAWSGTANASISNQQAFWIASWLSASGASTYQSVVESKVGTKSGAVFTRGGAADGIYVADVDVTAGNPYTFSAWIKTTTTHPLSMLLRFKEGTNTIINDMATEVTSSLVIGSWVRVSATFTAPTGSTKLQPMIRIMTAHTSTTFYVDGALVMDSPVDAPYFDGATPAAGDFTYHWAGTANASVSHQRVVLVPRLSASRSGATVNSRFFAYQSTAEDGKKTAKWLSPAGTADSTWRIAAIDSGSTSPGWDSTSVKAGGTYTLWLRYRSSGWGSGQVMQVMIADGSSQNQVIGYSSPNPPLNTNGWQEYRRTFTALRDGTASSTIYIALPTTPQTSTDGVLEIREWMLVEGGYNGDFIDGTKPFSKWDGTANQSTSVGYPPQFLDFAGKPMLSVYEESATLHPISGDPYDDFTFYLVYDALVASTEWTTLATIGGWVGGVTDWAGKGGISYGRRPTPIPDYDYSHARTGTGALSNQSGISVSGAIRGFTLRRHVVAVSVTNGVGYVKTILNGGAESVVQVQAGNGIAKEFVRVRTGASSTEGTASAHAKSHALHYYPGAHNLETRLAISRYLGNKYGANVA